MTKAMAELRSKEDSSAGELRPVRLVLAVLILLSMIFFASRWYATTVSIPRYCAQPETALHLLAAVMSEQKPAGDGPRRDYVVAAKLEFLLPARSDETAEAYLRRLRDHLRRECG